MASGSPAGTARCPTVTWNRAVVVNPGGNGALRIAAGTSPAARLAVALLQPAGHSSTSTGTARVASRRATRAASTPTKGA